MKVLRISANTGLGDMLTPSLLCAFADERAALERSGFRRFYFVDGSFNHPGSQACAGLSGGWNSASPPGWHYSRG
jgi:hypothetical protein